MTFADIMELASPLRLAVVATIAEDGSPQSAVVGIAVAPSGDVVFDTLADTRKARNLRRDPRVSLVIGWDDAQTIQLQGLADEPQGSELETLKASYFQAHPDGPSRLTWPGLIYVRVRPTWARYSDFREGSQRVVEAAPPRQS
jgi:PPOX class probable F420-dependent enzyme